jgi:hypothetical protein
VNKKDPGNQEDKQAQEVQGCGWISGPLQSLTDSLSVRVEPKGREMADIKRLFNPETIALIGAPTKKEPPEELSSKISSSPRGGRFSP